jgi:hypothetical protein
MHIRKLGYHKTPPVSMALNDILLKGDDKRETHFDVI